MVAPRAMGNYSENSLYTKAGSLNLAPRLADQANIQAPADFLPCLYPCVKERTRSS
jgi:hypothetical protein